MMSYPTPLIKLDGINIKLENQNPSGSIKDRIAEYIIDKAEKFGKIKKDYTIIEATSGNTGISFSRVAALRGYKMIVVMPRGMSKEREQFITGYGAKIIFVKPENFKGAMDKALILGKKSKTYLPRQFENPWNVEEHEKHLAKEIISQIKGKRIDAVVAGVGTGGTIIGVGKAVKKKNPRVKIFALEPSECHLLVSSGIGSIYSGNDKIDKDKKVCKHHEIQGIGDGIIPGIISNNKKVIDGVIGISSKEAMGETNKLAKRGYFVGPSSGANFIGAKILKEKHPKWNIVIFFCDRGDRYLSEGIY